MDKIFVAIRIEGNDEVGHFTIEVGSSEPLQVGDDKLFFIAHAKSYEELKMILELRELETERTEKAQAQLSLQGEIMELDEKIKGIQERREAINNEQGEPGNDDAT